MGLTQSQFETQNTMSHSEPMMYHSKDIYLTNTNSASSTAPYNQPDRPPTFHPAHYFYCLLYMLINIIIIIIVWIVCSTFTETHSRSLQLLASAMMRSKSLMRFMSNGALGYSRPGFRLTLVKIPNRSALKCVSPPRNRNASGGDTACLHTVMGHVTSNLKMGYLC